MPVQAIAVKTIAEKKILVMLTRFSPRLRIWVCSILTGMPWDVQRKVLVLLLLIYPRSDYDQHYTMEKVSKLT